LQGNCCFFGLSVASKVSSKVFVALENNVT
jgi:hypothetical protein